MAKKVKDSAKHPFHFAAKSSEMRYLFYSAEAAKEQGYLSAFVKAADGGRRKVNYTLDSNDPKAKIYLWKDKKQVWAGKASDYELVRESERHKERREEHARMEEKIGDSFPKPRRY